MTFSELSRALKSIAIVALDGVPCGFDNEVFDPSGADVFAKCSFIPVTNDVLSKDALAQFDRGIFQVSVYCQKDSKDYDIKQLETIDRAIAGFRKSEQNRLKFNAVNVAAGYYSGAFFVRHLSIEYIAN